MNKKIIGLIAAVIAVCGLVLVMSLRGCNATVDVQKETEAVDAGGTEQTELQETQPTETLNHNGSYVMGGSSESEWEDEDSTVETSGKTENTEATEPTKVTEPIKETEPTKTTEPTKETEPTEETIPETKPQAGGTSALTEYEKYMAMSPEEQQNFYNSFSSVPAFFEWLQNAKEAYEAGLDYVEIGGSPVDIESVLSGNG